MARHTDEALASIPKHFQAFLISRIRKWLSRTGYDHPDNAERVLCQCLGAIWLRMREEGRLQDAVQWDRALRHALYVEFERGRNLHWAQIQFHELLAAGENLSDFCNIPQAWHTWLDLFEAAEGHPARVAQSFGWTRRQMKVQLSEVYRHLTDDNCYINLKRRATRIQDKLMSCRALDKGTEKEVRLLIRLLGWLELPTEFRQLRRQLRIEVRKKCQGDLGSQAVATANVGLRAKA